MLLLTLGSSDQSPATVPRTSWKRQDVNLYEFSEPGIFNYTTLLLHEQREVLYVGAREAIFELSLRNISVKNHKVVWKVPDVATEVCTSKGKSKETDCLNYIRVLELSDSHLYVCGTHAFQPLCDHLSLADFKLEGRQEDGRGKCSFDPMQSFTAVMVDGDLYSGTAYNFLGSEPIISRNGATQSPLRTEYSTSWLNEPSFVFADVVRENEGGDEDDKIYFFFTEASMEYDFFSKLLIPRVARVCKCINKDIRQQNITSSLMLPDKTLQFVRDHPLLEDAVRPMDNGPRFIAKDVHYTQIAVERVPALDGQLYDVMFMGTDKGNLHKSVLYQKEVHIIEEVELFPNSESVKTLVMPSHGAQFLYVGSDSRAVQSPTAFCEKYHMCEDCLLARDPYCAWDRGAGACVNILQEDRSRGHLIQNLQGNADECPTGQNQSTKAYQQLWVKPGGAVKLPCQVESNVAQVVWTVNGSVLQERSPPYQRIAEGLLVYGAGPEDQGYYKCWAVEEADHRNFTWLLQSFELALAKDHLYPTTEDPSVFTVVDVGFTARPVPTFEMPEPTRLVLTSSVSRPPGDQESRDKELVPPQYLESDRGMTLLLTFTLLFLLLFLVTVSYNCYMQYLPGPCLRARASLLGAKKPPQSEYRSCEAGLVDNVTDQHQGLPKGPNGVQKVGRDGEGMSGVVQEGSGAPSPGVVCQSPHSEKPFDIDSEGQPIEYADADVEAP
uniref:Semaphorin 4D n=1 Tax=Scleropages formosus TaxID=113540 RepID=A0A8C9VJU1_SCLFO